MSGVSLWAIVFMMPAVAALGQKVTATHQHLNLEIQPRLPLSAEQDSIRQIYEKIMINPNHRGLCFETDLTDFSLRSATISTPIDSEVYKYPSLKCYTFERGDQNFYVRTSLSADQEIDFAFKVSILDTARVLFYQIISRPIILPFTFVPKGELASDSSLVGNSNDLTLISAKLESFCISTKEITNAQVCEFLQEYNQDTTTAGLWLDWKSKYCHIKYKNSIFSVEPGFEQHPAVEVSWQGAMEYCNWLSRIEKQKYGVARTYRLPTEAEWEYAARYSRAESLPGGNLDGIQGRDHWYETAPVDSLEKSDIGLYHMAGNVREWCSNLYNDDPKLYCNSPVTAMDKTKAMSIRGGSWNLPKEYARISRRDGLEPDRSSYDLGFRVVLVHR